MTISDLTGIPRPTVIRKLNFLIKNKFIDKNKNGLYVVSNSNKIKEIDKFRLKMLIKFQRCHVNCLMQPEFIKIKNF